MSTKYMVWSSFRWRKVNERIDMCHCIYYLNFSTIVDYGVDVVPSKNAWKGKENLVRAAQAKKDLELQDGRGNQDAACQVCGEKAPLKRDKNGDILVPCATKIAMVWNPIPRLPCMFRNNPYEIYLYKLWY